MQERRHAKEARHAKDPIMPRTTSSPRTRGSLSLSKAKGFPLALLPTEPGDCRGRCRALAMSRVCEKTGAGCPGNTAFEGMTVSDGNEG